jgi:hypothetical protein
VDINNLPEKYPKYTKPETEIDYGVSAFPKVYREKKKPKGLKKTPLKAHYNPIPIEVKKAVLEEKGSLCFCGFCEHCGGQAECTINDDFHHHPKRSHGGQNIIAHLYPGKRICHDYYETHPLEEKEMFQRMEAAGYPVVWRIQGKKIGVI